MATIQRRVTRTGHVRYRAQVRIKNQPWVSATFHKRSDGTKWARETESAQITGVYSPPQAQLRYRFSDAVDRYRREVLPTKSTDEQKRQLFQLRRWHDLQNCANCCFAQAIRTVNYFAEPYEGEGKLVAVEIDGEMIRRMPTKAFDDSPLPYQKCLKRVLKKASALQGHPESLRLTHPQYSQLMSDFDHLCVIQDGEFDGIKDQMTVEFVSVWFRKPRLGENVGDVVIGYPAGRCGLLPERVIDDPILLRRNVAALLALDFNILLVGDGESILSHANDRLDQLAREFTDQCGNQ